MKIEKVNDNQIRCTLTKEDLADRQLKLSELAYGTENAKALFRDMMQQAAYEFGFEAEDIPLMIEAVPMSADTIILIITKVEYPEELDTRFSKFSESSGDDIFSDNISDGNAAVVPEGADDILDLFKKMQGDDEIELKHDSVKEDSTSSDFVPLSETIAAKNEKRKTKTAPVDVIMDLSRLFIFHHMEDMTRLASILQDFYDEHNTLYRSNDSHSYYLIITKGHHTPEEFNKVCNILSEYAYPQKYTSAQEAYFEEHFSVLLKDNALQLLATI